MTFEEIDQLVRRANPVPEPTVLAPVPSPVEDDVHRGAAMQTQDMTSGATIQRGGGHRFDARWVAIAATAAVALVVALVAASAGGGDDGIDAASDLSTSPVELADSFVASLAAFDAPAASLHLTSDSLAASGGADGLARDLRWREASGFQWIFDDCTQVGGGNDHTIVRCPFAYHGIRSDELGFAPYEGSSYRLVVRDGRIDGFAEQIEFIQNGFSKEVWEPFHRWLLENHPDDVSRMYTDPSASGQRTTDESIDLWERRSREYADDVGG